MNISPATLHVQRKRACSSSVTSYGKLYERRLCVHTSLQDTYRSVQPCAGVRVSAGFRWAAARVGRCRRSGRKKRGDGEEDRVRRAENGLRKLLIGARISSGGVDGKRGNRDDDGENRKPFALSISRRDDGPRISAACVRRTLQRCRRRRTALEESRFSRKRDHVSGQL